MKIKLKIEKKKKMDLISKEMFLNLGIDYNDAGLLFHYLYDRKITEKKNFINIIEEKITDDQIFFSNPV